MKAKPNTAAPKPKEKDEDQRKEDRKRKAVRYIKKGIYLALYWVLYRGAWILVVVA